MRVWSTSAKGSWKLVIEYDGTRYSGWQIQKNARSVQEELLKAARNVLKCEVEIGGAGRTDAGVHASGQVAHMRCEQQSIPVKDLMYSINSHLPKDINILSLEEAPISFHARHDAIMRYYVYQISRRRTAFAKNYVWWVRDRLHVDRMCKAASLLYGMHDFRSFSEPTPQRESTRVKIEEAQILQAGDLLLFRIGASHFLWKMVRRIVGTLVEVGRGHLSVDAFSQLLEQPKETAQWTAPPSGLFLTQVLYKGDQPPGELKPVVLL